ncbi:hypothetical protein [Streptomyces sp. NRRL B-24484]|uniref:hypothetical protein n=1 Tax=Streptomyces sp. NRRL B-24484 TaxID=1463833 RepID=UPI0004C00FD9|nr:hypothetical protein [Streptomyces sp. NRRL B-24484]
MNPSARNAAKELRLRARDTRAEARTHRPQNPAKLAKSCRTRARSLMTHALAAGVDPATAKSVVSALRSAAERKNIKPTEKARTRRTHEGWGRTVRTSRRYSRAKVVELLEAYKPRAAATRAARELMLAA